VALNRDDMTGGADAGGDVSAGDDGHGQAESPAGWPLMSRFLQPLVPAGYGLRVADVQEVVDLKQDTQCKCNILGRSSPRKNEEAVWVIRPHVVV